MPMNPTPRSWQTLVRVLLFCLLCAIILAVVSPLAARLPAQWSQLALGSVATLATFILTLLFIRWEGFRLPDIGAMPGSQSPPRFALGFLIGLTLVALQSLLLAVIGHVHWVHTPQSNLAPTATALLLYLILATREELAFRGYPLRVLDRIFGPWPAQLIVAFIFALEHRAGGYTWLHAFFGAALGSLLFGIAALTTRGLALPIGIHAALNFGLWLTGANNSSGPWHPVIEKAFESRFDQLNSLAYLIVMTVAILLFYRYANKHHLLNTPK